MLRIILHRDIYEPNSQAHAHTMETIDIEAPQLEALLTRGGYGPEGHDLTHFAGVEILKPQN